MATVSEESTKKNSLLLNSLEIRSFRGFQHLKIEHLGRVNLIVGKNNVGKTALLEALRLYASRASPEVVWELLGARDESRRFNFSEQLPSLKYIFYGRKEIDPSLEPIQIGSLDPLNAKLSISLGWYARQVDETGNAKLHRLQPEEYGTVDKADIRLTIQLGEEENFSYPLDVTISRLFRHGLKEINHTFGAANGLGRRQVGALWDSIALTDLEKDVLAAIRIIAPGVEGLNLVVDPVSSLQDRIPIVKVAGIDEPLPLRNLGDGTQRMLGIALALVNAKDGMLLVDEIENGLHYSVLPDLWRIIFQLARRLNVQVFATTHSWDCIEGFQQAAQEDKQAEGLLIRLDLKKAKIVPTLFDERELAIATREQIEVR